MKNRGFTLAEVLITLGVIGVVSALTMPILINKYKDIVLTNRFKKGYSQISQAWRQVVAEDPDMYTGRGGWKCEWSDDENKDYNVIDGRGNALIKKFKNIKKCNTDEECWPNKFENYKNIFPGEGTNIKKDVWMTPDGMCISLVMKDIDDVHIALDTNCKQKPNKLGDDIFSMLLGADGIVYFATDSNSINHNPVSKGQVCPNFSGGFTVNGRTVNFRDRLLK